MPPEVIEQALDISNNQGPITVDWLDKQWVKGYSRLIVGSGPPPYGQYTEQQIVTALSHGKMAVEAYTYLEWGWDPVEWVREALRACGDHESYVRRWWTDVEDDKNIAKCPSLALRVAYVDKAIQEFARWAITSHIYTGAWFWTPYMANEPRWANEGRWLWASDYSQQVLWPGCPWTWDKTAMFQTAGSVDMDGVSADLNVVYADENWRTAVTIAQDVEQLRVDLNALMLAALAGSERDPMSILDKTVIANGYLKQAGQFQSVMDVARSALVVAMQAHPASGIATLTDAELAEIAAKTAALLKISVS